MLLVESSRQTPDPPGRFTVPCQQDAVVPPPKLVLGKPVPLGPLLDQEHEVGRAPADFEIFRFDNRRDGITALAKPRTVNPIPIVAEHHRADNAPAVLSPD